jgi:uncharacterized protein YcfJ
MAALALGPAACANMTKTQQGTVSGAAGGALVGTVIGAVAKGNSKGAAAGAAIGAVAGGLAGAMVGNTQEQYDQGYSKEAPADPAYKGRDYKAPAK